jgi:hypothetical protein
MAPQTKNPIDYTEFLSQFPHNKSKDNKERILALSHPVKNSEKGHKVYFHVFYYDKFS